MLILNINPDNSHICLGEHCLGDRIEVIPIAWRNSLLLDYTILVLVYVLETNTFCMMLVPDQSDGSEYTSHMIVNQVGNIVTLGIRSYKGLRFAFRCSVPKHMPLEVPAFVIDQFEHSEPNVKKRTP